MSKESKVLLKVRDEQLIMELGNHTISFECDEIEIFDLNDRLVGHWKF